MTEIITEIQNALAEVTTEDTFNVSLVNALHGSPFIWELDYPIALVNAKGRMEEVKDIKHFEAKHLFDESGVTPLQPSILQLNAIAEIGSRYLQRVSIMCLEYEPESPPLFQIKHQNDYWKKIQDVTHIKSMIETAVWQDGIGVCDVEFSLREIIRKRKEVHALKDVGFVWIAVTSDDVSEVFRHYFHDNYTLIKTETQSFHIGWSPTLREINMRYFVCPPK